MEDTWFSRDLPVLEIAVRLLDASGHPIRAAEIRNETELDMDEVARALTALEGPYITEMDRFWGPRARVTA